MQCDESKLMLKRAYTLLQVIEIEILEGWNTLTSRSSD